jgi:hypothetical protein
VRVINNRLNITIAILIFIRFFIITTFWKCHSHSTSNGIDLVAIKALYQKKFVDKLAPKLPSHTCHPKIIRRQSNKQVQVAHVGAPSQNAPSNRINKCAKDIQGRPGPQ